jgi:hypothetical protein
LAGKVKDKYGDSIQVDVVRPQDRMDGGNREAPAAPNIAVDGQLLGKRVSLAELDRTVSERLKA